MRSLMLAHALNGEINLTILEIIILFSIFVLLPIAIFFLIIKMSKTKNE